jgi:hypothetical protein
MAKNRRKLAFYVVSILVVLLLLGLVFLILRLPVNNTRAANDTATKFFEEVKKDSIDTSYAMTSKDFQISTPKEDWKTLIESNSLKQNQGVNWSKVEQKDNKMVMEGTIKKPESEGKVKMELINEDNQWKVYLLELP